MLGSFIGGLFVDPALHRSGIGRLLVEHAASLKGPLSLEVYALNAPARAFYVRLGFLDGTSRPMDDNGLPLEVIRMVMRKP